MEFRWHWVRDVDRHWREAIAQAFDPGALAPATVSRRRSIAGRSYGVMAGPEGVPFGIFVKMFAHASLRERLRHLWNLSGAAREFANAVRLYEMGLPAPRPLALVDECGNWGCTTSYLLSEYVPAARTLKDCLAAAGDPGSPAFDALARAVARPLLDLVASGVWHRDANADNLLVTLDSEGRPSRVCLVDARRVEFSVTSPAAAFERMLTALVGFLLADGLNERAVLALATVAADVAAERGGAMRLVEPQTAMLLGRRLAEQLIERDVRKGRRAADALEVFACRYATAPDAQKYRDMRFARSRYGRKVDAAERRIVEQVIQGRRIRGPILDAPCGSGRFMTIFATGGGEVVGADISPEMLLLARRSLAQAGYSHPCITADVRRLPFEGRRFELVFSMRLLHRVRTPGQRLEVLRELARVSRKWVLFSFYDRRSWRSLRDALRRRYAGETRGAIRAEVAEAGMRLHAFYPAGRMASQTLVLCEVNG
jgi:SAM-dependent methyltransferase